MSNGRSRRWILHGSFNAFALYSFFLLSFFFFFPNKPLFTWLTYFDDMQWCKFREMRVVTLFPREMSGIFSFQRVNFNEGVCESSLRHFRLGDRFAIPFPLKSA